MSVLFLLIPLSILVAGGFLAAFVWAVRSGQYEDTTTPGMRLLLEEEARSARRSEPISRTENHQEP
jgi:cbb3-type cytochrome oxidase maturation protein